MKKLVLLVSVFLLMAGMIFADVTFEPVVTGEASVTWGADLTLDNGKINSGFDAANTATLDLGIVLDPASVSKSGEGVYGEITVSGLAVTGKSGSSVTVAVPSVDAKLFFSEALYMRVATNPAPLYNWSESLGNMVAVGGDDFHGTWFDSGEDNNDSTVVGDWGNAGYGLTYKAGAFTANLDFVSDDTWGQSDNLIAFAFDDYDVDDSGFIEAGELATLISDVANTDAASSNDVTYRVDSTELNVAGTTVYDIPLNGDDEFQLVEIDADDDETLVYGVLSGLSDVNSGLYSVGVDVAYAVDGLGSFAAYVLPTHSDAWTYFDIINFGVKADLAPIEMVGLVVAFDGVMDNSDDATRESYDDFEYEFSVSVPVSVAGVALNLKASATDTQDTTDDDSTLDLYADVAYAVAGASLSGKVLYRDAFDSYDGSMAYSVAASYPGVVTPSAQFDCDLGKVGTKSDEKGILTLAAAASMIDNTTFTLKWVSGDMLVADKSENDGGVITFETKIAY